MAVLSSEMSELKRLLQILQPVVPISPATFLQEDEERSSRKMEEEPLSSSSPSCHTEYDVLSTISSDSFFQEHPNVCVQSYPQETQAVLSKAEGSREYSVHSGLNPSSADGTLSVLRMAVARLGLDSSPTQPTQANVLQFVQCLSLRKCDLCWRREQYK